MLMTPPQRPRLLAALVLSALVLDFLAVAPSAALAQAVPMPNAPMPNAPAPHRPAPHRPAPPPLSDRERALAPGTLAALRAMAEWGAWTFGVSGPGPDFAERERVRLAAALGSTTLDAAGAIVNAPRNLAILAPTWINLPDRVRAPVTRLVQQRHGNPSDPDGPGKLAEDVAAMAQLFARNGGPRWAAQLNR